MTSFGGWLDLTARRLVVPPEELLGVMRKMPKLDDYRVLGSNAQ